MNQADARIEPACFTSRFLPWCTYLDKIFLGPNSQAPHYFSSQKGIVRDLIKKPFY